MIQDAIKKIVERRDLTEDEAGDAMRSIMEGTATPSQIAGFITALRMKGETAAEITGFARVMRDKATRIAPRVAHCVDTCGTGGDGAHTFNISTAAAFVAAGAGIAVAKHGNRSVSSRCGSADVLEALGVNIALAPDQVKSCIEEAGIGFLFAPTFHPCMKHAGVPRRELAIRTVFNILGPLTNPAGAQGQVLGVFSLEYARLMAEVLKNLGTERALVVHGTDGLDEITLTGPTDMFEVENGKVTQLAVEPEMFGLARVKPEALKGGDARDNAAILLSVLHGRRGSARDVVLLNAAAAIWAGKRAASLKEAVDLAEDSVQSRRALRRLEALKAVTQSFKAAA